MEQSTHTAATLLIQLAETDPDALKSSATYGNWLEHLIDYVADLDEGKLSSS